MDNCKGLEEALRAKKREKAAGVFGSGRSFLFDWKAQACKPEACHMVNTNLTPAIIQSNLQLLTLCTPSYAAILNIENCQLRPRKRLAG